VVLNAAITFAQVPKAPDPARPDVVVPAPVEKAAGVRPAAPVFVPAKEFLDLSRLRLAGDELDPLIQQFSARLGGVLRAELRVVRAVCRPTKEQQEAIARDATNSFRELAQKQAFEQKERSQGRPRPPSDPRTTIRDSLTRAVKAHLSPEQAARYQAELDDRIANDKQVVVRTLVARIDQEVSLSTDQREKLCASLTSNWNSNWFKHLDLLLYGGRILPQIPDQYVVPILDPRQKKIWTSAQKAEIDTGQFGLGGLVMTRDDLAEEEEPAEGRYLGPVLRK
jgi:hypothetical protein